MACSSLVNSCVAFSLAARAALASMMASSFAAMWAATRRATWQVHISKRLSGRPMPHTFIWYDEEGVDGVLLSGAQVFSGCLELINSN